MAGRDGVPGGLRSARTGMRPMMRTRSVDSGVLGSGAGVRMKGVLDRVTFRDFQEC